METQLKDRAQKSVVHPPSEMSWFHKHVTRGETEVFTEIADITPDIARRLLENNSDNRPINKGLVDAITRDISNGNWKMNGETVIVSKDGLLNDGQNRLSAVIAANRSIRTAIIFGLPRETRMTVDMGRQRRTSDFLAMGGVKNSTYIAATVTLYINFSRKRYANGGGVAPTKQDMLTEYERDAAVFDHAVTTMRGSESRLTRVMS